MAALSAPVTINDPVTADLTAAAADQGAEQAAAGTSMAALSAPVTIDDPVTADLTAAAGDKGAEQAAAGTSMAALSAPVTIDAAAAAAVAPPAFVQVKCGDAADQSVVGGGHLHRCAGRRETPTSWPSAGTTRPPISPSVTDSAGNTYQLAVPTARGSGVSQAIYYAPNIKAAAAGTNTVTTTFNAATPYVDVRALEYSGLDPVNPFDVGASASGTGTSATSGTVSTTAANALIFGAGMTTGGFSAAGTNFTTRIITTPDADIAEDRIVTAAGPYSATAPLSGRLGHAGRHLQGRGRRRRRYDTTHGGDHRSRSQRDRLRHRDPHRQRHRQCRGGRGAVPGGQQCPGRRGHHLALQRVVEYHDGRQRRPHADRTCPRRQPATPQSRRR